MEKGVPTPKVLVSDRAQIVMSYHKLFDAYEEEIGWKIIRFPEVQDRTVYSDKYANRLSGQRTVRR